MKKHGKTRRNGKRVYFNENYFEKIDSINKAYFLGLLYADGSTFIKKKTDNSLSYVIAIDINTLDSAVLEKLNVELNNDRGVYHYQRESEEYKGEVRTRNMSKITLFSKKMFDDLWNLGKKPSKIDTCLTVPNILNELKKHFLRGYFDGDGSVTTSNNKISVHIYGTFEFLNSYKKSFEDLGIHFSNKVHKKRDANVSMLSLNNTEEIKKMYSIFYDGDGVYMQRRKNRFLELL